MYRKSIMNMALVSCAVVCLTGCGMIQKTESDETTETVTVIETTMEQTTQCNSELETQQETTEMTEDDNSTEITEEESEEMNVTPKFKEMMDAYEEFFDEYIEFMNKYANANSNDMMAMMSDYLSYLSKYAETMDKMNSIDQNELSTSDKLYYIDVTTRINQKLMKIAVQQEQRN